MKAEICEGENCLPSEATQASPLPARMILYGTSPISFLVMGSSKVRPIRRLIAKKVRSGLVTPWRLAGWPTRRSPSSVNATIDGVVRAPSEFSMTLGVDPSMTATHELVVPRSMPITLAIAHILSSRNRRPRSCLAQGGLDPAVVPTAPNRPAPDKQMTNFRGSPRSGAYIRGGLRARKARPGRDLEGKARNFAALA